MSKEITKNKNVSSVDLLKNRLLRLERVLQQLLQSSVNGTQNNLPGVNINDSNQENYLTKLAMPSVSNPNNVNQPTVFTIKPTLNNQKSGKNSLILSQGQIIAELASAIARASQRNS